MQLTINVIRTHPRRLLFSSWTVVVSYEVVFTPIFDQNNNLKP